MDELFGDENNTTNEWLDSLSDENQSYKRMDAMVDSLRPKKTTIEKVFNVSPIRKTDNNSDNSYDNSVYEFDGHMGSMGTMGSDLSFDKSKSHRKYSSNKSSNFSPIMRSTPKPSRARALRQSQRNARIRKKSHNNRMSSQGLWDKAIHKNPELRQWIDSFNEDMKQIESSELSVSQSSISFTD